MERFLKLCRSAEAESSEIPEGGLPSWSREARKLGRFPRDLLAVASPRHCKRNQLLVSAHSNQNSTSQITVTTRDSRRHRDPLDNQHPYASMQRYAELLALKYQKMKENEPFSDPQFLSSFVNRRRFCNESLFQKNQNK